MVRESLKATVPHASGDHSHCGETWCGYFKDPPSYTNNSLPHGRHHKRERVQQGLKGVMEVFVQNAVKLAPRGSSQGNRAINNIIGSKAPKIHHYGEAATTMN